MKVLFTFFIFYLGLPGFGQTREGLDQLKKIIAGEKNTMYMFCRGTKSKSALIAKKFNEQDTSSTHVGLGIVTRGQLVIYNVTDKHGRYSDAMMRDSLESFIDLPDLYYLSVWECLLTIKELKKLEELCVRYSRRQIYFDGSFRISGDDTLYCAEFCALVLNSIGVPGLYFKPKTTTLNDRLLELTLGRKSITYFPVDFFLASNRFRKIFERRFD